MFSQLSSISLLNRMQDTGQIPPLAARTNANGKLDHAVMGCLDLPTRAYVHPFLGTTEQYATLGFVFVALSRCLYSQKCMLCLDQLSYTYKIFLQVLEFWSLLTVRTFWKRSPVQNLSLAAKAHTQQPKRHTLGSISASASFLYTMRHGTATGLLLADHSLLHGQRAYSESVASQCCGHLQTSTTSNET